MKNISLCFTLVAFALVLVGGMIRGDGTAVEIAILLSPLGMVTMLLSIKLHKTSAHVLNMVAAVMWLAIPVTYLIGRDAGEMMFMYSLIFGPVVLACILMLWTSAWMVRGEEEVKSVDVSIHGRRSELILPQPSAEARPQKKR